MAELTTAKVIASGGIAEQSDLVKLQEIQLLKRPMKWEKQSAKIYGIYIEKWMPQSPGGILFFLYSGIYANPDILPFPHRWYTSPFLS